MSYDAASKKVVIKADQCLGCDVCAQICPKNAIVKA
jgi:indolepyruvate ferredoxin oxidoreductase alpha subunit